MFLFCRWQKCDTSKHKVVVASVCPQSLPFFAVQFGLDITEAAHKLCSFLKSLGVKFVFDTTVAAGFSILETQKEFIQRYRRRHHDSHALPMFTSSCPGWIRYAERVLGSLVTPHICTARSPQQIMGCLVKDYFSKQQVSCSKPYHGGNICYKVISMFCFDNLIFAMKAREFWSFKAPRENFISNRFKLQKLSPEKVYHMVVAPCFDKKLEAVREEFYNSLMDTRDVDCVLTSTIGTKAHI
ncbi:hypothetical protein GOODEAATRI_025215 [Goodea atripinnis]|uniref:Iron hydrogenase large subunit C-terminal domain-containing protein n=1 Tax=Goodea atripinnis TaxID=208336 RepID=A0ABV0MV04_9TELE